MADLSQLGSIQQLPGTFLPIGALGTNAGDDSLAIQSAIDAAFAYGNGRVYLPDGQYRTTKTLKMRNGVSIWGQSYKGTVVLPVGNIHAFTTTNCSDIGFYNFGINATGQTTSGTFPENAGVFGQSVTNVEYLNVEIQKTFGSAVLHLLSTNLRGEFCYFHNCGDNAPVASTANGFDFQGCTDQDVSKNRFTDFTRRFGHGVSINNYGTFANADRFNVEGNRFSNFGNLAQSGAGFIAVFSHSTNAAWRAKNGTVRGNIGDGTADSGIWINADNCSVTANEVTNSQGFGFEFQDCKNGSCVGNIATNCDSEGFIFHNAGVGGGLFDLVGLNNFAIDDNTVRSCGAGVNAGSPRFGMNIQHDGTNSRVEDLNLTGNDVRDCVGGGIILQLIKGNYTLTANVTMDNDTALAGRAGIEVYGNASPADCSGGALVANRSGDTRVGGARTQGRGIWIRNLADRQLLVGNIAFNNVTSQILVDGTVTNTPALIAGANIVA